MKNIILSLAVLLSFAPLAHADSSSWIKVAGHVAFQNESDRLVIEANGVELYSVAPSKLPVIMAGGDFIGYAVTKQFDYSVDVNTAAITTALSTYIVHADGTRSY